MYLALHPSLVADLSGCPPDVCDSVSEFFGRELVDAPPNGAVPMVDVTCQEISVPRNARLIGTNTACDDRYLYRVDPLGQCMAYRLDGPDHATLIVDPRALPLMFLSILQYLMRNLAPARNLAFVHASGVIHDGQGVLFPAWGGTGKTTLVLQFLANGAGYMGDDLVLLDASGVMYPCTNRLNLLSYNLRQFESWLLPSFKPQIRRYYRISNITGRMDRLVGAGPFKKALPARLLRLVQRRMEARVQQYIPPHQIFPQSLPGAPTPAGTVLFLTRVQGKEINVIPGDPESLAARMAACLWWERQSFGDEVLLYQFAFPEQRSLLLEMLTHEEQIIRDGFRSSGRLLELRVGNMVSNREFFEVACEAIAEQR